MKKNFKTLILENLKTLIYALILAIIIRSLFFQPFFIPSSSMEPNLLVGDRLFVTKYSYGYSKNSFPFSPNLTDIILFDRDPSRGDVVVFKTPADNRTDYIKRLVGLPGDTIQFIDGEFFINDKKVVRKKIGNELVIYCGDEILDTVTYEEELPGGKKYIAVYRKEGTILNTIKYEVPKNHYFFLGDNRDCSKDSRFLSSVGYVNKLNFVGKAKIIFFSHNSRVGSFIKFWTWKSHFRFKRLFKKI